MTRLRQPIQCAAQIFTDHTADVIRMCDHIVQRAILGEPFHRRLGTDFFNARYIVHRITDQRKVIHDALGRHTEFGDHTIAIKLFITHGVDQRDLFIDQLRKILITRRYHGIKTQRGRLHCECANHVVGLNTFDH